MNIDEAIKLVTSTIKNIKKIDDELSIDASLIGTKALPDQWNW